MRIVFILVFFCLMSLETVAQNVAKTLSSIALDGRWNVTFDLPGQQYQTIIEFSAANDGRVSATVLDSTSLKFNDGRLAENKLLLKVTSLRGTGEVNATLDGNRFVGRYQIGLLGGEVRGTRDSTNRPLVSRLAVFDNVWNIINQQFYDPHFNGVDWQSVRARYRPQAEAARTEGELFTLVTSMLGELRSSHLLLSAVPFEQLFVSTEEKTNGVKPPPIVWRKLSPKVGYIQIKRFDESAEIIRLVDSAFAELGDSPSLVIDVRGNGGGTLSAAMRLGDYLFATKRPVGYIANRAGFVRGETQPVKQDKSATMATYSGYNVIDFMGELKRSGAVMLTTGGRAKLYRGRVVILINEGSGSTTEGFVSVAQEARVATLIGRRTAGAVLTSVEVPIVGGWTLRVPTADFRTPNGIRVEGRGVEPDIKVQKSLAGDADLERALSFLETNATQSSQ